jgi:hypothetical protein
MTDPLDEALAAMDQTLGIEEAPAEGTPSETTEQPRNEKGQYTATDPEPEAAPEAETVEETAEQLLAGKYRSAEDLERAYKELESRFGSQGSELAELRRTIDQHLQDTSSPQVPLDQNTTDWFQEQVDSNPYGAAVWALQNDRSGVLYHRAMDAWYDLEPRQAASFERQLELNQLKQEFQQQLQQTTQPIAEQEMARAFREAAERHPDVKDNLQSLLQSAVESSPVVTQTLIDTARAAGDFETKVQVLNGIIALAKGQSASAVTEAVQGAADEEAARARQMKQSGGVATQTQAVGAELVSPEEQWLRDNFDRFLAPAE